MPDHGKLDQHATLSCLPHERTVNGHIHDISTCGGARDHARSSNTCGVMRVDMDRKIGVGSPDGTNETKAGEIYQ